MADTDEHFKDSLELITGKRAEVKDLYDEIKEHYDTIKKEKNRSTLSFIYNQTANLVSLINADISLIKEYNSVKKVISDTELKKSQMENKDSDAQAGAMAKELYTLIKQDIRQKDNEPDSEVPVDTDKMDAELERRLEELDIDTDDIKQDVTQEKIVRAVSDQNGNVYLVTDNEDGTLEFVESTDQFDVSLIEVSIETTDDGETKAYDQHGNEMQVVEVEYE